MVKPKWWNWQTRMVEGHVPYRVWGFESPFGIEAGAVIFFLVFLVFFLALF